MLNDRRIVYKALESKRMSISRVQYRSLRADLLSAGFPRRWADFAAIRHIQSSMFFR